MGRIGAARKSPDVYALSLMNAILGGQFISRINMNLREEKGYSYGAESSFSFLRGPGPFEVVGTVQTAVTKESLVEIFKELTDITGKRPVTDAELAFAKQRMIQGFPHRFETTFGVAGQLAILIAEELPDDEFTRYQATGRIRHQGRRRPRRARVHHRPRRWPCSSWAIDPRSRDRSRACRSSSRSSSRRRGRQPRRRQIPSEAGGRATGHVAARRHGRAQR